MSIVRDSRKFSGHPYVGRITRSSLRQLSFLVNYWCFVVRLVCFLLLLLSLLLFYGLLSEINWMDGWMDGLAYRPTGRPMCRKFAIRLYRLPTVFNCRVGSQMATIQVSNRIKQSDCALIKQICVYIGRPIT